MRLDPCRACRYCVVHQDAVARCHRESPIMLRGSETATWPRIEANAPGCGRAKPHEAEVHGG
jgi:hypothetical protein